MTKTSWHLIAEKWPLLQTLKTSSGQASDGQPRGKSDPATASIINLSIVVLEVEILDMIQRHCAIVRARGGKATNLGGLLKELYPIGAPNPERQAWESFGSDFLEEIQQLLKEKPRPITQHKIDMLKEYPNQFTLNTPTTWAALTLLGYNIADRTMRNYAKDLGPNYTLAQAINRVENKGRHTTSSTRTTQTFPLS